MQATKRRFQVISDLHLSNNNYQINKNTTIFDRLTPEDHVDGLILAGDLSPIFYLAQCNCELDSLEDLINCTCKPHQRSDIFGHIYDWLSSYDRVIYVAGNHEYYSGAFHGDGLTVDLMDQVAKNILPNNVEYCGNENKVFNYMGVNFICSTLWAPGGRTPMEEVDIKTMLNDFVLIPEFTYETMVERYKENVKWIEDALVIRRNQQILEKSQSPDHNDKTIVVTHHAPSKRSVHSRFANSLCNGAFAGDLDVMIEGNPIIDYWIHGHTHNSFEYEVGLTKVICNPRGYQYNRGIENEFFDELKIIEL